MYKKAVLLTMSLIIMGCSTTTQERIPTNSLNRHDPKSTAELKLLMKRMLDEHKELNEEKREKVKNILENGLDRSYLLKQKESQIVQVYFADVLVKDVSEKELNNVKEEIKRIYSDRVENFLQTFDEVNTVLGRDKKNEPIANDFFYNSRDLR
jgi:F0F1-type ATP synthase alpha subunit